MPDGGQELRGVGLADLVPAFLGNGYAFLTVIYSDQASGETLSFKYYNSTSGVLHDLNENEEFISDMFYGDATNDGSYVLSP